MSSLDELAIKHGTDKSSLHHGYTELYEAYLSPLRRDPVSVLELGWGGPPDSGVGGSSAMMWRDWFENATVVCIDNVDKPIGPEHRGVVFRQGDQSDKGFLDALSYEFGPWDVVIDDASHLSSLTIRSWEILYPHLKSGGYYFVEDTHSSYHDFYYGRSEANANPDGRLPRRRRTTMQYLKRLADEVNFHSDNGWDLFPPRFYLGYQLETIHFYFNIAVIKKR